MVTKIPIPNWKSIDSKGETFDFFEYQDDKWILLIFFRGKFCGLCRKLLMKINDHFGKLEKLGVKPVAVSGDTRLGAAVLHTFLMMRFPNIPDEQLEIAKFFGVPAEKKGHGTYLLPAIFLINPKHEIVWARKGETFEDVVEFEELLTAIRKCMDNN
ncbi:MAG: redoxin domain-containing protein [Patescibacteria group bacterium]